MHIKKEHLNYLKEAVINQIWTVSDQLEKVNDATEEEKRGKSYQLLLRDLTHEKEALVDMKRDIEQEMYNTSCGMKTNEDLNKIDTLAKELARAIRNVNHAKSNREEEGLVSFYNGSIESIENTAKAMGFTTDDLLKSQYFPINLINEGTH